MENYAMYLRKSRADIELESIEKFDTLKRHKKILTELANKKELHVADIYEEIVSGESIADRPQMQALLKAVYQKRYKGVLVVEVERLARGDTKDQGEVAEAFKYSNTLIITPTKTYDPSNQFDEEYLEFGLFMSRREYKTIRRRMETGIRESVKDGNYIGSIAPYGYDKVKLSKESKTLKPNENAKYVKMMFDLFTKENLTSGQIAKRLNEIGVPTLTGGEWSRASVTDMLQNITYTGKVRWNRRRCKKEYCEDGMKRKKRRLSLDESMVYDGKHEAIISAEQFELAQTKFNHAPVTHSETIVNPLSGLLICKHCGKSIRYNAYATKKNVQPRYIHPESRTCKMKSMLASEVIDGVCDALKTLADDFEVKAKEVKQPTINTAELIEKELASALKRREDIMEYFEKKIYSLDEFIERREKINKKIDDLKKQLEIEKENQPNAEQLKEIATTFYALVDTLKDETIDAKDKNIFLKSIIGSIEYDVEDLGRQHGGKATLDIHIK